MTKPSVVIVIPARYSSKRFPGKALAKINGVEMVVRVQQACQLMYPTYVVTDDTQIKNVVEEYGPTVLVTDGVASGTDRIALAVLRGKIPADDSTIVVNVQGDQPLVGKVHVDLAMQALIEGYSRDKERFVCGSIYHPERMTDDPNSVKVVTDRDDEALYFSRAPIPYGGNVCKKHIGIYAMTFKALYRFYVAQDHGLETDERLEQLRFLENGMRISMRAVGLDCPSVNAPEDVVAVEALMNAELERA